MTTRRMPTPTGPYRATALVGAGLAARVAMRSRRLDDRWAWQRDTGAIQLNALRSLLETAAQTDFGRAHDFARLAAISDGRAMLRAYRAAVPVVDWYGFKDRITRMREGGEPNVLWPGLVRDFAQTSGTTAGDKFIPVTRQMFRSNYRASLDIFAHLMRWGVSVPRLMSGRCLFLGGSSAVSENEHGVRTGDLSGLVTPLIKWPLTAIYSPGAEIALMDDWTAKIEAMAELTSRQDVRMISGMPSWAGVLMNRVLEMMGKRTIQEVWPNLELFVHGGVKYTPFMPRINELVSGDPELDLPSRLELYPASEAFVALQDEPGEPSLRLLADGGNFFEFVPLETIDEPDAPACMADEVEPGVRYVVVLTTCAGLWRYVLGDVVEFDTVPDGPGRTGTGPARLRIVGRHRHFINAFGENIIVEHIEHAVSEAAGQTGLAVGEFTAAPIYATAAHRAGLELAVEIEGAPAPGELERFGSAFDAAIKAVNVDYTTKRKDDLSMAPPTITPLPAGAFHRWMASRGKLGGQHKCPRCANHREIIEAVIESAGQPV